MKPPPVHKIKATKTVNPFVKESSAFVAYYLKILSFKSGYYLKMSRGGDSGRLCNNTGLVSLYSTYGGNILRKVKNSSRNKNFTNQKFFRYLFPQGEANFRIKIL
jgi:hypothetical protein